MPIETFGHVDTVADATDEGAPLYLIWGVDNVPYGPVELPALVNWIKEERVVADTWVYVQERKKWLQAPAVPELKMFFQKKKGAGGTSESADTIATDLQIKPSSLRRIKIFADLDDNQLQAFLKFMEIVPVRPGVHVLHKGDAAEAMYLVLEGELRSAFFVETKETPVATLAPGSIFGEISLLDGGPHTLDVIANKESLLIRISVEAFEKVVREAPQLMLPFLVSLSRAIAGRVRVLTKRYEDSVHLSQTAPVVQAA